MTSTQPPLTPAPTVLEVPTSVGPALPDIREALDMSATVAGVLTGLPGLSFAVVGAGAHFRARKTTR